MDLCFPEITVAWTQKRQMWRGRKRRILMFGLTQRLFMPVERCAPWPGWHKAIGRILVVVCRPAGSVRPEARYTSACLWCSDSLGSCVGSGVSHGKLPPITCDCLLTRTVMPVVHRAGHVLAGGWGEAQSWQINRASWWLLHLTQLSFHTGKLEPVHPRCWRLKGCFGDQTLTAHVWPPARAGLHRCGQHRKQGPVTHLPACFPQLHG